MKRFIDLFAYILTYALCYVMAFIGLLMAFVGYLAESNIMLIIFTLMFCWFVYAQVVLHFNIETEKRRAK